MRAACFAFALIVCALPTAADAAPVSTEEIRRLIEPRLDVCMEIPIGAYRLGAADKAFDAQMTGLEKRGFITVTTIGQGDSLISGDSDLERLEEQRPFSRLVDVALAGTIDRSALCTLTRHRIGVPLGMQTLTAVTRVEPVGDGSEAQVLVEGTLDRVLSRYALAFDPTLTPKATFQAVLGYDNLAKAWVVRRFATQNVRGGAD